MSTNTKSAPIYRAENLLDGLDIKFILSKLMRQKWVILSFVLISSLLGSFYVFTTMPKYVSTALIQVDGQLGSANSMQQMLGNIGITLSQSGQASPADIEIALIKSSFILQSVIDKLQMNIKVTPHYLPIIGASIARVRSDQGLRQPILGLSQFAWGGEKIRLSQFEVPHQDRGIQYRLRYDGNKHYSLWMPDGSLILRAKVHELAVTQDANQPLIKIFVKELRANPGTYFDISLTNDEAILQELSQSLSISDLGNKDKTKTGVLQLALQGSNPHFIPSVLNTIVDYAIQRNIEKKSAEASKTLDFLNRQLPSVRVSLENAETALNEYRAKSGTIDITQEAKIILMQLSAVEQHIADVKLKKAEMLQDLTPVHPFIIALSQRQQQLQKEVLSLEKKIKTMPRTDQRALSLERDVKVKNQLYLLLLNKIQQLQVLKAGTLSDIRVLNMATAPIEPLPAHKYFKFLMSILFGLLMGMMTVFMRDMVRQRQNNSELIEECLGIPTYAIVPYSMKQKQFNREIRRNPTAEHFFVLALDSPKDIAIEGIRNLRTVLQLNVAQAKNNVISVLGASPSIGKSFISINLTQVLADIGKNVILIDCDLRKGKSNLHLGKKKSPGFSEVLMGKQRLEEVIHHIGVGFDFIAAGTYPRNPSELLMSSHFRNLVNKLSQQYDLVIIDTPPVLAVTDAIVIAKHAGTNLMVIGSDDLLDELQLTVKRVKRNDIEIDGLIFNHKVHTEATYGQCNYYYAYEEQS